MFLPAKEVYNVLIEKGVTQFFHANSFATAHQFLRSGCLISRGVIERRGLFQTTQISDKTDKEQGIWYDVFVDSDDIHERAGNANYYGPVLFVISLKILRQKDMPPVWVTKCNPTKWTANQIHSEQWFTSIDDLRSNFNKGEFDQMIVFRHIGGELPFKTHLEKIILDDPIYRDEENDLYSIVKEELIKSSKNGALKKEIELVKINLSI
jgi:hypothetical protein